MPLQRTDGVGLILRHSLSKDSGHNKHNCDAQHVTGVWVQINDLNVIVVAVPKTIKKMISNSNHKETQPFEIRTTKQVPVLNKFKFYWAAEQDSDTN